MALELPESASPAARRISASPVPCRLSLDSQLSELVPDRCCVSSLSAPCWSSTQMPDPVSPSHFRHTSCLEDTHCPRQVAPRLHCSGSLLLDHHDSIRP